MLRERCAPDLASSPEVHLTPLTVYGALTTPTSEKPHECHQHDASRLTLLLNELRLPAIKHLLQRFAEWV